VGLDGGKTDIQLQGQLFVAGALAQQQRDLTLFGGQSDSESSKGCMLATAICSSACKALS
jgi:hypothetical protein